MIDKPFVFGVSEYTTWHWSFVEDVDRYAKMGVDTIEICEFKLDASPIAAQIARATEHGLRVSSVQPTVHTIYPDSLEPQPTEPLDRVTRIRQAIERIGPHVPPSTPFILNTGVAPDGNIREALSRTVSECRALASFAADYRVRIALEPLNPVLMNQNSFIWTLAQALQIVGRVDLPNFGICVDVWNNWQDPEVHRSLRACGDRIFAVHISDWHLPRAAADRTTVGKGEIPLPELLQTIHATGYRGAYTLEIFSDDALPDSLWQADGKHVVSDSRAGLERAWARAFVKESA